MARTYRHQSTSAALFALITFTAPGLVAPGMAHHSVWAEFDNASLVEMRGHFIEMDWINPHSWVHFEVQQANDKADDSRVAWAAETPPPNQLIRQGWRRSDIDAGDEILVRGYIARNGSNRIWARDVLIVAQDGVELAEPRTVLALFDPKPEGVPDGVLPGRNRQGQD